MGLTTSQSITFQRIRTSSTSKQAVALSDDSIRALVAIAARDLGVLERLPLSGHVPDLFDDQLSADFSLPGPSPIKLFESLCALNPDADTYVACLASLHKARLKYRQVLASQPFARMDQVGPRGLLQYGQVEVSALAALLVWRKWLYDIDNRAAQDTGYLVEPVIAGALGGTPYSAKASPIKRVSDSRKGRQVDCIKDDRAYEFKLRMTIAASGQGRWSEELDFAEDVRSSGYVPILLVLDPTKSSKLAQLKASFEAAGGECYTGDDAWAHLYEDARDDMRSFISKYIETPLRQLFLALPEGRSLPKFEVHDLGTSVKFVIGEESWHVARGAPSPEMVEPEVIPDDAGDFLPGVD